MDHSKWVAAKEQQTGDPAVFIIPEIPCCWEEMAHYHLNKMFTEVSTPTHTHTRILNVQINGFFLHLLKKYFQQNIFYICKKKYFQQNIKYFQHPQEIPHAAS